jgi:DMSO/TMAO reductase YedYZ molybdopterin-dependent catalytic subunit/mono/diheme cytochrome c family protein
MPKPNNSRREFLRKLGIGGGAVALTSCAKGVLPLDNGGLHEPRWEGGAAAAEPLECPEPVKPPLPDGLNPDNFHVHNEGPLALETKRSRLGSSPITPVGVLFVRNNLPMPDVSIVEDRDAWKLEVKGVSTERTFTLAELKTLGRSFETSVLQCSGNGRAFFGHGPSGSQWSVGAAGCVVWCGVRVSELAKLLGGPVEGVNFLTATGGETLPPGVDPKAAMVERSVPAAKGIKDCLLAWEMNGEPIPITHGGPLRLVVPGYFGCNNIKYIKTLAFTEHESGAKIQQKGYRYRPLGDAGSPSQPSLWRMPVKSWVNGPGADDELTLAGKVYFHGVAFSGERGVTKIEVSMDLGKTWAPAHLDGPSMGPNAWRAFHFAVDLDEGEYTIVSRATDTQGDVQPRNRDENERGYRYSAWEEAALTVKVVKTLPKKAPVSIAPAKTTSGPKLPKKKVDLSEAGVRGKEVFSTTAEPGCGVCHGLSDAGAQGAVGPNLDDLKPSAEQVSSAVTNGVGIMPSFGAALTPEQIADLSQYIKEVTQ